MPQCIREMQLNGLEWVIFINKNSTINMFIQHHGILQQKQPVAAPPDSISLSEYHLSFYNDGTAKTTDSVVVTSSGHWTAFCQDDPDNIINSYTMEGDDQDDLQVTLFSWGGSDITGVVIDVSCGTAGPVQLVICEDGYDYQCS